ncbi:retrovirus-related pol polyprotein from transposon TNT 1-94, partial [Tanacetum coccineum]
NAKATDQTECHKCSKKGHFASDCWSKALVPSYQSLIQPKPLSSSQHKPELRPSKDFKAKYNKVKTKLALLSSSALASKAATIKNKCLIAEAYEWDEEEVSSDDNEMVDVKVLMALAEENDDISKEDARNGEWVKISMRKVHTLLEMEDNDDRKTYLDYLILPVKSQRNTTDPLVFVTNSLATDYDSMDESSVCSTPLPPLDKLDGAKPISGPKTIKSILNSKSTFKAETLKGVKINEPSLAPSKGNKNSLASKVNLAPASKLKSVKIKDDPPLAICERTDHKTCDHDEYISTMNMSQHLKSLGRSSSRSKIPRPSKRFFPPCIHCGCIDHLSNECLYYPICRLCGSYDHDTNGHNRIISLEREINPRNPQHAFKRCEACGSSTHTTTDHYDIEWFKRGEALQAKKAEALKLTRYDIRKPILYLDSGCSRHMTGDKSYLDKYHQSTQATASPVEGEKNTTKDAKTNLQNELVDLLGIDMVEQYHNKKLLFDKYCDKMLKRRNNSKIINCDVLIQKGPISLKVYREDRTIKVIANFKVSD